MHTATATAPRRSTMHLRYTPAAHRRRMGLASHHPSRADRELLEKLLAAWR